MRHPAILAAAVALVTVALISGAQAQVPPPNPTLPKPVPPPPVGTPVVPPGPAEPFLTGAFAFPADFHYHTQLLGYGFKPGEHVRLSGDHVAVDAVAVTADESGSFAVPVDFTWVFCGPSARSDPPPVFHATGDDGSAATMEFQAPQCPELLVRPKIEDIPPPGNPGTGPGVVVGTAIAVTSLPLTAMPATTPEPVTPMPVPTWPPRLQSFDVRGFGFAPGEIVTLTEKDSPVPAPPAGSATADAAGRFEATVQAYVPGLCSGAPEPSLIATGDRGTSAQAPIWTIEPMIACPIRGGPDVPPVPNPSPAAAATSVTSSSLSLSLAPPVAKRGRGERATLHTSGAGTAKMTIRYPGRGTGHLTVSIGRSGLGTAKWTIPSQARKGTATISVSFMPGKLSLKTSLRIR